jgi:putative tryptophan/tyrosine transport system substrate-binding protein
MRLIGLVLVLILTVPLAAEAQQTGKIAKIGVLGLPITDDPEYRKLWEAFAGGLREYGWIENRNVVLERRAPEEGPERYSRPAAELVALQPDIIVTGQGEPAILALRKATTTIPIVMLVAADPVGTGLVAKLARPGGIRRGRGTPELWCQSRRSLPACGWPCGQDPEGRQAV